MMSAQSRISCMYSVLCLTGTLAVHAALFDLTRVDSLGLFLDSRSAVTLEN